MKIKIKLLDKKIRGFFNNTKCRRVRDSIVPGNSGSLWKAVSVAKDINHNQLPKPLFANNVKINEGDTADLMCLLYILIKKLETLSAQLSLRKMFTMEQRKSILEQKTSCADTT
jgi:hypothetical protein